MKWYNQKFSGQLGVGVMGVGSVPVTLGVNEFLKDYVAAAAIILGVIQSEDRISIREWKQISFNRQKKVLLVSGP